jgi:hypothetical protein
MFRLPLRSWRKGLRLRIMLPFCRWRRTVIIGAPYRFWCRLVVITPAIEIASAITSVPSGLLIHHFGIAVTVSSSAFIRSVRLWLWRWIISPRHSRHIVIRVHAPVAFISTGTAWRTIVAIMANIPAVN